MDTSTTGLEIRAFLEEEGTDPCNDSAGRGFRERIQGARTAGSAHP